MNEVQFYRDAAGDWRWRYLHANGNVMADSGQGYARRIDAYTAARTVLGNKVKMVDALTLDDLHGHYGEDLQEGQ